MTAKEKHRSWGHFGTLRRKVIMATFSTFPLSLLYLKMKICIGTEWSFVPSVLCMKNSFMRTWAQKCVPTVVSLSTKMLIPRRAQQKCAHRSVIEYEDTHTTEGTKIATLYQHISSYLPIAAKKNIEIWVILGPSEKSNYDQNFNFPLSLLYLKMNSYAGTE